MAIWKNNTAMRVAYGMKAANALWRSHIQTLEHPSMMHITLKLGKWSHICMAVGYHGHEQGNFGLWDNSLAQKP